ncbi:Pimeloyl-ACP methyl ester carboxylesterase [Rhizobiales bacterium GAS188]|nr:Pimeloyl-ACP methyl ester carboxylesterase [Rhizobiales bacterium GAS188]
MNDIATKPASAGVRFVTSRDGTRIAYERLGSGAPVILVGGAFNDRRGKASGVPLARLLASHFTVFAYDRRGRGDSTETPPYDAAREVEDLEALLAAADGAASVFGMSSGAALALEAAASGLKIAKLALYEPPFSIDADAQARSVSYERRLRELLAAGDSDGAVALFLGHVGVPSQMVDQMRHAPMWPGLKAMAASLAHDSAVMGDAHGGAVPVERIRPITAPVLVLGGGLSPPFMRQAAETIVGAVRNGSHQSLAGQAHDVSVDVLAPALISFFSDGRV